MNNARATYNAALRDLELKLDRGTREMNRMPEGQGKEDRKRDLELTERRRRQLIAAGE